MTTDKEKIRAAVTGGYLLVINPSEILALLDALDKAENDAERYHKLIHNIGLVEAHAVAWNPGKHKPLIQYLQDYIYAKIAPVGGGE